MPLVNIPGFGFTWPHMEEGLRASGNHLLSTNLLDAADEWAAWVFQIPKSGNLSKIHFRTAVVTTGATVEVTIEGVDSSGDPNGTPITNGSTTVVIAGGDDNVRKEAVFSPACAVTRGQRVALKIKNPSVSPGNLSLNSGDAGNRCTSFPYSVLNQGSVVKGFAGGNLLFEYDDGSYGLVPGFWPCVVFGSQNIVSGGLEEAGNIIRVPFKCKAVGWWFKGNYDDTGSGAELRFYDADGATPTLLESFTIDEDYISTGGGVGGYARVLWSQEIALKPNVDYRATVKGGATQNFQLFWTAFSAAAHMAAMSGGTACHWTERNGSNPFVQDASSRLGIGLLLSEISDGARGSSHFGSRLRPAAFSPGLGR